MSKPKISVIIPTKNEQDNLPKLLKSLAKQTFEDFEVIVVDNNSIDKTAEIAKKFTNKVFTAGPERSSQRNFGVRIAKGKYVLFLDADMELEPTVLAECYESMQKDQSGAGVVIDEVAVGRGFLTKIKALEKKLYAGTEIMEAARFFRKQDILKIGGFDENLIAGEDWDLSQRIRNKGKFERIGAKIYHLEEHSLFQDLRKKYYYAKHIQKYALKHPKIFAKQAGAIYRFQLLFKNPKTILSHPLEFLGLLFLKFAHFIAYLTAKTFQYEI